MSEDPKMTEDDFLDDDTLIEGPSDFSSGSEFDALGPEPRRGSAVPLLVTVLVILGFGGGGYYAMVSDPALLHDLGKTLGVDSLFVQAAPPASVDPVLDTGTPLPETPQESPLASTPPLAEPSSPVVEQASAEDLNGALHDLQSLANNVSESTTPIPSSEEPTPVAEGEIPQPAPVVNAPDSISLSPQLVPVNTEAAGDTASASDETGLPSKLKPGQRVAKAPGSTKDSGSQLQYFDPGAKGTIGPGTPFWNAQKNAKASSIPEGAIIVTSPLTENRQEAKMVAAQRAFQAGRYETSLRFYNEILEANPKETAALLGRATVLQRLGQKDQAAKVYDDILATDPENTQALVNMLGLVREDYPAVAVERLRALYTKHPDSPAIVAQLGVAQADLKNYEEALQYLARAVALEPSNAQHYFNMGVIAERMEKPDLAIDYYEKALTVDAASSSHRIDRDQVYDRLSHLR